VAQVTDQDQALWELRAAYDRVYRIWRSGGQYKASRNALDPRIMAADTPGKMRELLAADRQAWAAESRSR
jgi:hypothetical protein